METLNQLPRPEGRPMHSYFLDNADNDSPFCEAFRYVLATGQRPESFLSITQLDEHLMICNNILGRPIYSADTEVKAWADELQAAIHRS